MAFSERPEISLGMGLATVALVWATFNSALPSIAEARVTEPGDRDLASAERTAAWTATALVAGVSLIAKDATVFVLGGATIIGLSWLHRHANAVHPGLGKATLANADYTASYASTMAA